MFGLLQIVPRVRFEIELDIFLPSFCLRSHQNTKHNGVVIIHG